MNVYGGLGRVGLDHDKRGNSDDEDREVEEELAPGFSASALRYVNTSSAKKSEKEAEEEDNLLADDEELDEALDKIGEEVDS